MTQAAGETGTQTASTTGPEGAASTTGPEGEAEGDKGFTGKPSVIPPAKAAAATEGEKTETAEPEAARLEAEVAQLRQENGKARVTAKERAAQEAVEAKMQEVAKALGLVKGDEKADPAALQRQIEEHQAAVRERDQELAVYRCSNEHSADPNRLLDSRKFLASIKDLDPTDEKAIGAAIKAAVDADSSLKTQVRATSASSASHSGGSGEKREVKDLSLADAVKDSYGA
jgi:hypothetical protein